MTTLLRVPTASLPFTLPAWTATEPSTAETDTAAANQNPHPTPEPPRAQAAAVSAIGPLTRRPNGRWAWTLPGYEGIAQAVDRAFVPARPAGPAGPPPTRRGRTKGIP